MSDARTNLKPRFQAAVFDLDDTLYLERDYVRSGFRTVATEIGRSSNVAEESAFSFLWDQFTAGVRGNSFDLLLKQHPSISCEFSKTKLVSIYRSHQPKIELPKSIRVLLEKLKEEGCATGIISDGAFASQQAKVTVLCLESLIDKIVLTDTWGSSFWKPHPRAFTTMMNTWQFSPSEIVFVADNPKKDFVTPKQMGWTTVRLRIPGQLHFELEATSDDLAAHMEIRSYEELSKLLLPTN